MRKRYNWKDKDILILEDDMLNLRLFKENFNKFSNANMYYITDIFNLENNLKNFHSIDLIVTDIKFPSGEIFPHLQKLKDACNGNLIVQSAFYLKEDENSNKKYVYEWFNKPIPFDELFETINDLIGEENGK